MIVEKVPEEKEPEVSEIAEIPEEQVELEKGYYLCFYFMLRFKKRSVLTLRRISRTWSMILMRRIWMN